MATDHTEKSTHSATLYFDLSSVDGQSEFHNAVNGWKFRNVLGLMDQELRNILKYQSPGEEASRLLEALRSNLHDNLHQQGVVLDD